MTVLRRKKESLVWQWVRAHAGENYDIERFEPGMPIGMSDCFWTDRRDTISGWLELKTSSVLDSDFQRGYIPKLGKSQPYFMLRRAKFGCPAGILLRSESDLYIWRAFGTNEWVRDIMSNRAISLVTAVIPARSATLDDVLRIVRGRTL